jgi:hypothetical protein
MIPERPEFVRQRLGKNLDMCACAQRALDPPRGERTPARDDDGLAANVEKYRKMVHVSG